MTSSAEENYLKAIYKLHETSGAMVTTSELADSLKVSAASVTDFIKKIAAKKLVTYEKSKGVKLTDSGKQIAVNIIRKHRLWEVWLVDKLNFKWDEVHDIAEQLEHIKSEQLINKLDEFLGNPTEDPHGDPIPNANGQIVAIEKQLLSELAENQIGICVGVKDSSAEFLKYLDKQEIALGSKIEIMAKESFDLSTKIKVNGKELTISNKIANNLYVKGI